MAAIPTILKGDDSGSISLTLATGRTYTGATLILAYQGATRQFTDLSAGQTISFSFTHDETANFELGTKPLLMRLVGQNGGEETVANSEARIKVTDCLSEVNSGGSFVVTPGGQDIPVTDVGDLADRYTLADLQAKINQIVHVLAQRSLLALAILLSLNAPASLIQHTCTVSNLWSDALVVTNVTGESGGGVDTNVVCNLITNNVADWALFGQPKPEGGGVDTNVVRDLIASAAVTNAGAVAYADSKFMIRDSPYDSQTITGPVRFNNGVDFYNEEVIFHYNTRFHSGVFVDYADDFRIGDQGLPTYLASTTWHGSNKALADYGITNTIPNTSGFITQSAANAAYYPKSQGDAWSTYWDGDDVRVTVTNYDSSVNLPSLYLEQRTNETALATNLFKTVWREMAHWEAFLGTNWNWRSAWSGFSAWRDSIEDDLAEKADKAWGFYNSHTGEYSPDGYTVISSSNVMIAAGMSYQKTLATSSEVWVLTASEPYEPTGISTNGGFQIKDGDGNVQFEIIKGDKVTVAAQAHAVGVTNSTLYVVYNIVAAQHPTAEVCLDLSTANWKTETASDCPATVVWSGVSGRYVAAITPKSATTKCFCKATYQRGGETYINNRCAVGMSQLVLGGVTYNLGTATIDGNTVLTLTPAN